MVYTHQLVVRKYLVGLIRMAVMMHVKIDKPMTETLDPISICIGEEILVPMALYGTTESNKPDKLSFI